MKNIKRLLLIVASILLLIFSVFIFYKGNSGYNIFDISNSSIKKTNKDLKSELATAKDNLENKKVKTLELKQELGAIEKLKEEFTIINENSLEKYNLDDFDKLYVEKLVPLFDSNAMVSAGDRGNDYVKLNNFFYEKSKDIPLGENILIAQFINSYTVQNSVNSSIVDYNLNMFRYLGLLKYYRNRSNFLIKSKIYNKLLEEYKSFQIDVINKKFINEAGMLLDLKRTMLNNYRLMLSNSSYNINDINNLSNFLILENNKFNLKEIDTHDSKLLQYKNLHLNLAFYLETLNNSINYLEGFKVMEKTYDNKGNPKRIKYLLNDRDNILIIEEDNKEENSILSYYNIDGALIMKVNSSTSEVYYTKETLEDKENENVINARKLYNSLKY